MSVFSLAKEILLMYGTWQMNTLKYMKLFAEIIRFGMYASILFIMALAIFNWLPHENTVRMKALLYIMSIYIIFSIHAIHWFMMICGDIRGMCAPLIGYGAFSLLVYAVYPTEQATFVSVTVLSVICIQALCTHLVEHMITQATGKSLPDRQCIACNASSTPTVHMYS